MMTLTHLASNPNESRGRLYKENATTYYDNFQLDRSRIINSTAFRRLMYKTQVFTNDTHDLYRTRLTHTLEVAQLAKTLAYNLGLNIDLAETIALAHDLGHSPFGHAGEEALNKAMQPYGGFNHNAQTIKIITSLEHQYPEFNGLNLCFETLTGIVKHNGKFETDNANDFIAPYLVKEYNSRYNLELNQQPSLEAQIASIVDDVAYIIHDIDDGLRSSLFTLNDISRLAPLIYQIHKEIRDEQPRLNDETRIKYEILRKLSHICIDDLYKTTMQNIQSMRIKSKQDIYSSPYLVVQFSQKMWDNIRDIKAFLFENLYKHYLVNRMASKADMILRSLFNFYMNSPQTLPTEWYNHFKVQSSTSQQAIVISDYLAGMTDRYAIEEYNKLLYV